jgi:hypothetical protein
MNDELTIYCGASYDVDFLALESDGSPMDLTGGTASFEIGFPLKLLAETTDFSAGAGDTVLNSGRISLTPEQTGSAGQFNTTSSYLLWVKLPNDRVEVLSDGKVFLKKGPYARAGAPQVQSLSRPRLTVVERLRSRA